MMYDTIIIGGGVAGITAAIYATRRKLKVLILTMDLGGQLGKINEIENWPGEEHISGPELALKLNKQIQKFSIEIKYAQAIKISTINNTFSIATSTEQIETRSIILAFGKVPRTLNIEGEEEFLGKGVSYCATCDAPFFKDKIVAVMGGGNSAIDAALLLAKIATKVYLIHRRQEFRAEKHLLKQLEGTSNIEKILDVTIQKITGEQRLQNITLSNGQNLACDGLFIEAGFVVNNSLVKDLIECDQNGSIITDNQQSTSVPGIFAAGDMTNHPYQQLIIAAGQGASAALSAYDYLQTHHSQI